MLKQIRWLWENMDAPCRVRHVAALCISVLTCLMLLVNPALSQRLIDDVIVAQNPEPLLITKFFPSTCGRALCSCGKSSAR